MSYKGDIINSQKELDILKKTKTYLIVKAKYGPSKPTKIPLLLSEKLACFVAAIIGDGHLRKNKFQINLVGFDKQNILNFQIIAQEIFNRRFNIMDGRENDKDRYCLIMDSKAIHQLLLEVFEIPSGKKSERVIVPKYIQLANKSIKASFIIGLLIAEGGVRRRGYGMSTASKILWDNLEELFLSLNIEIKRDRWINKKYQKEYYGLSFKKSCLQEIIDNCKDKHIGRILSQHKGFIG